LAEAGVFLRLSFFVVAPDDRDAVACPAWVSAGSPRQTNEAKTQRKCALVVRRFDITGSNSLEDRWLQRDIGILANNLEYASFLSDVRDTHPSSCTAFPRKVPHSMSLTESEFTALRQTIANRGTTRVVLLPVTIIGWSALACTLLFVSDFPIASLFPLAVLVAGFEAIHALHVGVERIGRYLQVYYESSENGPQWETTAMAVGPALPGGGVDPLFTVVFASVTVLNLIPALLPTPIEILEIAVIGLLHTLFLVRLVRARGAAARQRAVELESYRAVKSGHSTAKS